MGHYELLEKIGVGGMGTVYRGRHLGTGELVAVKLMAESLMAEPVSLRRFEQEYTAAQRLTHPHLVRSLDFGVEGEQPYLVMEFVDGPSLGELVRAEGPLTPEDAVRIAAQVAAALHAAHEQRLVHRDVKPDNVLLGSDGRARLTDLGLIKDLDSEAMLTRPRAWLGTLGYTAPEQFGEACRVDARADVYALGATLYYALTGLSPFTGAGSMTILRKKLASEFAPPRVLVPALDEVICRSLNASPTNRPLSCLEFAKLLTAGAAQVSLPDGTAPSNRREAIRHSSSLAILCRLDGSGDNLGAAVQDVSRTGICVQLRYPVGPGDLLVLSAFSGEPDSEICLQARVRWARGTASGSWRLGCEFERAITQAELETLIGEQTPTYFVGETPMALHTPAH